MWGRSTDFEPTSAASNGTAALQAQRRHGIACDEMRTSFFLARETCVPAHRLQPGNHTSV